jgi:hypothetical protein
MIMSADLDSGVDMDMVKGFGIGSGTMFVSLGVVSSGKVFFDPLEDMG